MNKDAKKLEELLSEPFRVSLNMRLQAFYKDNIILLNQEKPVSEEIDPNEEDISLIRRNVEAGYLNVVDSDGNIVYQSFGLPRVTMNLNEKVNNKGKVNDDEIAALDKILDNKISDIEGHIESLNRVELLDAMLTLETKRKKPRKTITRLIRSRIDQLNAEKVK